MRVARRQKNLEGFLVEAPDREVAKDAAPGIERERIANTAGRQIGDLPRREQSNELRCP